MALRIITGVPGAGKTFYAVNHLAKNYCKMVGDTYELKNKYKIVTNIEGLLLDSVDLNAAIEKAGSPEKFFSIEVQKKVTEKYHKEKKSLVYFIDESQQYFHRRFYDRDVFSFFETHRHYGLDIYLVTQNVNLLAKDLVSLAEYEVRAIPRTLSIGGFNYLKKSNKEIIGRSFLSKNKKIFAMYKSMTGNETEKIRTPYLKYIIPFVLLLLLGSYLLSKSFFGRAMGLSDATASSSGPVTQKSVSRSSAEKNEVIVDDLHPFVQVSYSRNNSQVFVYDPISKDLCPVSVFPYELKAVASGKSIRLYARLPPFTQEQEKREN